MANLNKRLEKNLYSKHTLAFAPDGSFKILVFSDLQEPLEYDKRTLSGMNAITRACRPDLVVLGGDICDHESIKTPGQLRDYLGVFASPMESRSIPWAHVFGNHDHDLEIPEAAAQKIYESFPHCVSKHTGRGVYGTTNFVLPIYSSKGGDIRFCVWGLDSNNRFRDFSEKINAGHMSFENKLCGTPADYDIIRFDQIRWYYESSRGLERFAGSKIDALMVFHIGLHEMQMVHNNPEASHSVGTGAERLDPGALNSGLFAAALERGDIRHITFGHTHENDLAGTYCGVGLSYCASMGYSAYGPASRKGGRVFTVRENNTSVIETEMVYAENIQQVF